jgi:hypothetical protein
MALNEKCILFNGGKAIELSNAVGDNNGIKLAKNPNGSWQLSINAVISEDEAKKMIFKYSELKTRVPGGQKFEEVFPNMAYYEALADNGEAKFVPLAARSQITPSFNRDLNGTITLKLNVENFGKTQNPKTQNPSL